MSALPKFDERWFDGIDEADPAPADVPEPAPRTSTGAGFRIIQWARSVSISGAGRASAKSILLVLATHANRHGKAWPSQRTLAAEGCLGLKTVSRGIAKLEADGLISTEHGRRVRGRQYRDVNVYTLRFSTRQSDV